jgi:carbonic anhydrase
LQNYHHPKRLERTPRPEVHGWVIDLASGLVKDLKVSSSSPASLGYVYEVNKPEAVAAH